MMLRKYRASNMVKRAVAIAVGVVLGGPAVAATWSMVATGHNGAKASWCEVTKNCPTDNGAVDSDG